MQMPRFLRSGPAMGVPAAPSPSMLLSLLLTCAGVLAIAGFVFVAQSRGLTMSLLLAAGMLLALFIVVRPEIGIITLIGCAAVVRVSVSTGTGTPIVASLAVAGLLVCGWLVHQILNRQRVSLVPRSIAIPATLLAAATLFSLIWGRLALDPRVIYSPGFIRVQIAAAGLTIIALGLLFVGADLFRERRTRNIVLVVIVMIGIISLPYRYSAAEAPMMNAAGLFGVWLVAICWAHALGNDDLPDLARLGLAALAIGWLAMAITIEQTWVSGWLPPLIALLGVTIAVRPILGQFVALLGVVGVAFYNSLFYTMLITNEQQEGSLGGEFGRLELWKRNLEVVSDHLLFGTGPAGYALYYLTFVPDHAMSTHSNYVDVLAQNGIFGLIGLLWLLGSLFVLSHSVLRYTWHPSDRATAAAIAGGIPAVAASLWLGDWLIPFVYNQTLAGFDHAVYSWLMFAMLMGLATQARQRRVPDG